MSEITFNIKATMEERWIKHFIGFLKRMELDGNIGHSEMLAFYADGDGDFRPKFETNVEVKELSRIPIKEIKTPILVFDAG